MEWSRHYDNLLWGVTSLLTGANAALMGIAAEKISMQVGVFGIVLTVATVFFGASFRSIRRRLREGLEQARPGRFTLLIHGGEGWFWQWRVYVLFFAVVAGLWAWLLFAKFPQFWYIWLAVLSGSLLSQWRLFAASR